jgi:hypothetical protein
MTLNRHGHLMPGSREQIRDPVDAYLDARSTANVDNVLAIFRRPNRMILDACKAGTRG